MATAAYSFKNSVKTFNSIRTMVWVTKDDGVVSVRYLFGLGGAGRGGGSKGPVNLKGVTG